MKTFIAGKLRERLVIFVGFSILFFLFSSLLFISSANAASVSGSSISSSVSGSGRGITDITDDIYCKGLDHFNLPSPTPQCPHGTNNDNDNGDGDDNGDDDGSQENTPPVITLNGDSEITLTQGGVFTDQGVTATDAEDGDLTGDVVVGGDVVDSSTPGTYVVTYSVTDSDSMTDETSRTVIVVENEETTGDGDGNNGGGGSGGSDTDNSGDTTTSSGGGGGGGILNQSVPALVVKTAERTAVAPTACGTYLLEYIKFGGENNYVEVLKLQQFLRNDEDFKDVLLTGVYDDVTYNAVRSFQDRYASDILSPWGATQSTGFVYYTTQKKINELRCENKQQFTLTQSQLGEINSFKDRTSTAISDNLPLPDTTTVGSTDAPTLAVKKDILSEDNEKGDLEISTQTAGVADAVVVAESSMGRFFRKITGFFGRTFERFSH